MAQYTASSGDYIRPYRTPWGAFSIKHVAPLSTSAALYPGQLVALASTTSSNSHRFLPDTTAAKAGQAAFMIVGILAEGAAARATSSAVTPAVMPVWEANPMQEFIGTTMKQALASSVIGRRCPLNWDSTLNISQVDLSASTVTDARVVVTGILPEKTGHVDGDSGGYCTFRFISHLAGQVGSTLESSATLLAFYS